MKGMGKWMASCALAAMLCACGGGGGGDDGGGGTLNVSASGSTAQGTSVGTGQAATLNVQSGDYIALRTSAPVRWQAVITSNLTTVANQTLNDTNWSGNLISPTGDTIQLTATLASDASKVFKLNLTVAPQRYAAPAHKVGEVATFAETSQRLGGGSGTQHIAYTTTAVYNGIASVTGLNVDTNTPYQSYTQDQDRNRLTRTYLSNNNVCTYAPKRNLYSFPLYVGKTWTDSWNYSCAAGYHETGNVQANVAGYEPITTAAGTFNALRINYVITYTNSNDTQLPNGNLGTATYSETITSWWSPELGRMVKWVSNYGYAAGFSNATFMKVYTQELQSLQ
ncbi:hypothetical protein C7414_107113 [Cupriavidus alkaliphilus]|uniref:hypothetical protein n=1 Tax=Cupriavidus alkaliphilus TaxID=942866 RepID=UPI000DE76E21|nr:hypothetical protein [Cupriavidus alkaliphilus]PVY77784.1 hypothetical protein C7414_107113 [Cupriavidus alkaliphilus]